ncbi:MAG: hypothetical protein KF900_03955 [Bacteroidetes bacterium]|nr:hypothetical protein [Bacteroidota bacterium]
MKKLNRLNLLYSNIGYCVLGVFILFLLSCKKPKPDIPQPTPINTDTIKPKISFVFVNRLGWKQDSNSVRWFSGVNFRGKFYNPETNKSNLRSAVYIRNYLTEENRLKDSILLSQYISTKNAHYTLQVGLYWDYQYGTSNFAFKEMMCELPNYPNASDTIKVVRDTIIKFVYPDDTCSGRFNVRVDFR